MSVLAQNLFDIRGKRVMVTGASRGIGRAIALGFAQNGADVFAVARTQTALDELTAIAKAGGLRCDHLAMDLTGEDSAKSAVRTAADRLSGLDVLINNAAVDVEQDALALPFAEFERIMSFNVATNFALMCEACRIFTERGGGKIVNVTSVLSSVGIPDDCAYVASKHGLLGLTRALALEWARWNIQVNALAPGFVRTEMTRRDIEDERILRSVLRRTPIGRVAEPEEMVGGALFLASAASDFMTGQTLYLDGGWTAQ